MSGISIHALLAESDPLKRLRRKLPQISIHALLAESDGCTEAGRAGDIYFYPRSPCGERRWHWLLPLAPTKHFYPRSPCGERPVPPGHPAPGRYFYPRSPCGERHCHPRCRYFRNDFYPRSPCGERRARWVYRSRVRLFLSTLSLRRATRSTRPCWPWQIFLSTLSLRRATPAAVF